MQSAGVSELALRNLPATATLAEVQACLGALRPLSVEFNRDSVTGKFKGTVFVRLEDPSVSEKLISTGVSLNGRRIKVEASRRSLKSSTSSVSLNESRRSRVKSLVEDFVSSPASAFDLPADLTAEERKLAHSLAEKFGLKHETVGLSPDSHGSRSVRLSRLPPPGVLPPRQRAWTFGDAQDFLAPSLRREAPVFTPGSLRLPSPGGGATSSLATQVLPDWLQEERPRTSLVLHEKLLSNVWSCCVDERTSEYFAAVCF